MSADDVSRPARIVVVGGGFSGAMTAVQLARLSEVPLHVTVIDQQREVARGTAYRRRRPEYLLNVAARNMSAFPDEPDDLLRWLRTHPDFDATPEIELRERFVPRQIYGDYLRSIVKDHLQNPDETTPVSAAFVVGEVCDIEPLENGCLVHLANGSALEADRVVLALGNEPPAELPGAETLTGHPGWVGNPWRTWEDRLPPADGNIVILGTGLTAVDAIITLRALGWQGTVHAVSRHGWFPHAHFRGIEYPDFPPDVDLASLGLDRLLALINEHCAILHERNANPAIIVDKLRPYTQHIWAAFSPAERLEFAKRHAARWNVFRHRIAPDIHAQITSSQLTGQLRVHADSITKLVEIDDNRIRVELEGGHALDGDLVLNATGPSAKFTASRSMLLRNLLRRGLVAPDTADLGIRVDLDHTVLTGDDDRSRWLLALGPLLKGTYWETVAVPELRIQARHVAETLLDRVRTEDHEGPAQLEYML